MAIVTSDVLRLTLAGLKTTFDEAYTDAQVRAEWGRIATEIPTTLPIQDYGFLGRGAVMEEFKDRVREQEINQFTYSLADKTYKGDMVIERRTLEDDQYGLLQLRVRALGSEPVRHWNQLAFEGLALGATTLCYDGQYFFDTDHSEGSSGNQSNKGTSALSSDTLATAEQSMMGIVDDKGVPMEIRPDTLIVGPKNSQTAWELTMSPITVNKVGGGTAGSGATAATGYANYWQGKYTVIVSPYLRGTYDDYWFLADTSKVVKPVVIQSRSDVPITVESDMTEDSAKIKEKYQFCARGRYVQGYGLWQTAYAGIL